MQNSQTLTLILFLPINPALGNSATELSYHPNAEYLWPWKDAKRWKIILDLDKGKKSEKKFEMKQKQKTSYDLSPFLVKELEMVLYFSTTTVCSEDIK